MADNTRFEVLLILIFCINLVLTFTGVLDTSDEGNIISNFFKTNDNRPQDIEANFSSEVSGVTSLGTLSEGTAFQGFTDIPSALKGLYSLFLGTLTAPFQLWLNPKLGLPIAFQWLVGMPLSLLWVFSLVGFLLRGQ